MHECKCIRAKESYKVKLIF